MCSSDLVFGINVKKVNNQYKLLNNLYAMNFSEDDLKSINILSNSIKTFPEENTSSDIKKFIHELKIRMNYEDRNKLNISRSFFAYRMGRRVMQPKSS